MNHVTAKSARRICNAQKNDYIVEYKCGKRLRLRGCSDLRVKVLNYSDYCRSCLKKQPSKNDNGEKLTHQEKKARCKKSYKGCIVCKEPICEACWTTYDHGVSA
jgi:hypothetical protein